MIGKRLTKFANENSLTIKDEIAYGFYNGFLITLNQHHYNISVSFKVRIYDTPYGRKYSEILCDHKNKVIWSVSDIVFTDSYMEIVFNDTGNTIEKVKSCIDKLTQMMQEDKITSIKVCTVCGDPIDPENSGIYLNEGRAHIMNHSCVVKLNNDIAKQKRKYNCIKYRILVKMGRRKPVAIPKKIVKLK